ncbi:hypothetical protein [Brevundimonas lutea]|uniref:hypothetical protein n=1 Tax=Brevundimonas lutea TaxID=2293980 RepID=UPI000F0156FD|nr:hypothetical protein [Brevundimonas lutea]
MDITDTLHPDDERWDRVRDRYLGGEPAWSVCADYRLALSTFRARARREGWRRCDQPSETTPPLDPDEIDDEPFDPDLLVIRARAHLRRAVTAGDALNALRWMKMVEQLTDFARRERCVRVRHAPDPNGAEDEAREAAWRRRETLEGLILPDADPKDGLDAFLDPDPVMDSESNAGPVQSLSQAPDRLEQSESLCDELDSLDSFFSADELAAHPDLADAVRAMSALSPFLRDQPQNAPGREELSRCAPRSWRSSRLR